MGTLAGAVVALAACVIAPGLLFYFDITPKVAVLLCGAALALPWLALRARACRGFAMWMAAFWISLAVSTALSPHPELSVGGSNWRRMGLITWTAILILACVCSQLDRAGVRRALRAIALSGGGAAVYGIAQYFGFDPWLAPGAYRVGEGEWMIVRPPGPLGYVTYFSTYLVGAVFAGVALLGEERRGWRRAGLCSAALAVVAIILSGTRGAMAGLAAGALALAVWLRPRIGRRAVVAGAAVTVIALAFYYSPAGQQLRSRTRWYREDPAGGARLWLWRDAWTLARGHWAQGIGPESFVREFPRVQSVDLSRRYPDFYHESPHNIVLDVLAAQGAPGLILLLGGIGAAITAWRRAPLRYPAVAAGLAALLVTQQFSSFTAPTALLFFAWLGLLAAPAEPPSVGLRGHVFAAALALPVSAILILFAARLVVADHMLEGARAAIARTNTSDAIRHYRRAQEWAPDGFSADIWYARNIAAAAQRTRDIGQSHRAWQEALIAAARAVRSADDPQNAWYNLAVFFGAQNDAARAEQALRSAITVAPTWYKPRWLLSQVLRSTGRLEEAAAEATRATDLAGGKALEVRR